jgi:hypothetical protein
LDWPYFSGGDFNLVRTQKEKSNNNINFTHFAAFNDWINTWGLIEIRDPSRSFTWCNNQEIPIMATLDRVLATTDWECIYPRANVTIFSKGVSDLNPLKINLGVTTSNTKDHIFRFENGGCTRQASMTSLKRLGTLYAHHLIPLKCDSLKLDS